MCGSYTKDIEDNNRYRKSVLSHLDSNSKMKLRCCIFAKEETLDGELIYQFEESTIKTIQAKHGSVWYFTDGTCAITLTDVVGESSTTKRKCYTSVKFYPIYS